MRGYQRAVAIGALCATKRQEIQETIQKADHREWPVALTSIYAFLPPRGGLSARPRLVKVVPAFS
jgi:hypothetical protein